MEAKREISKEKLLHMTTPKVGMLEEKLLERCSLEEMKQIRPLCIKDTCFRKEREYVKWLSSQSQMLKYDL